MKKNVGLVILEHLSNKLNVHILDIDLLRIYISPMKKTKNLVAFTYLEILVQKHDGFVEFLLKPNYSLIMMDEAAIVYEHLPHS